ncbi:MAG: MG2 domain-containing protein [Caldilineales bacterium]
MDHLEFDLLAYLDGELSTAEETAVEAHLAECPACRGQLRRLATLHHSLHQVVAPVYQSVQLPHDAEARIRHALAGQRQRTTQGNPAGFLGGLLRVLRPLGAAAMPLMVLLFFAAALNANRLPINEGAQRTLLLGQQTLAPGSSAALRVVVNDAANQPVANAEVAVQLRQAGLAREVYRGQTDATGSTPVQFQVPPDWEGDAQLVVATNSSLGQDEVVTPIHLQRSYRLLLGSDKPVYQPGETVHLRTLALSSIDGSPAAGSVVQFEASDATGRRLLSQQQLASEFGIAAVDLPLAADAPLGPYQVRTTLGDTVSELTITLGQTPLPNFDVQVITDAPWYRPGNTLSGSVSARYFFGQPAVQAQVALRLVGRSLAQGDASAEQQVFSETLRGITDSNGLFAFRFTLPDPPAAAFGSEGSIQVSLEAAVVDANGDEEFGWHSVPLARQSLNIEVMPEDGVLHAGVENTLYLLVSRPDGSPAAAEVQVQIASGGVLQAATDAYGLAQISYTPRAGAEGDRQILVTATDDARQSTAVAFKLPINEAQITLLLRTDRALYQVGDTLAAEAIAAGSAEPVYLDIIKGGQTLVTQSATVTDGKATLAIDLTPALVGTLELNAYQIIDDNTVLRDTRVVVVDAPEALQVALMPDQAEYRPGDDVQISIHTTANGAAAPSAVGLAVVNEAVFSNRAYQPGFARAFFLLDQATGNAPLDTAGSDNADTAPALDAAQQASAKASWASYTGQEYSLAMQSLDQSLADGSLNARRTAFARLSRALSWPLAVLPLLAAVVALVSLRRSRVLGKALGRMALTAILFTVIGAALIFVTQSLLDRLTNTQDMILLAVVGLGWLAALAALMGYAWLQHHSHLLIVTLLTAGYMALLALLAFIQAEAASLSAPWVMLLAVAFMLLVLALILLGWGLRFEGLRRTGSALLLLALAMVPLFVIVGSVEWRGTQIIQRVALSPLYQLSTGLFTGCGAPPAPSMDQSAVSVLEQSTQQAGQPEAALLSEDTAAPMIMETVEVIKEVSRDELTAVPTAADSPAATPVAVDVELQAPVTVPVEAELPAAHLAFSLPVTLTDTFSATALVSDTAAFSVSLPISAFLNALPGFQLLQPSATATLTPTLPLLLTLRASETVTPTLNAATQAAADALTRSGATATATPTVTAEIAGLGQAAVITSTATATGTPTPTATLTASPTATATAEPTATPQPPAPAAAAPLPSAEPTATASATVTPPPLQIIEPPIGVPLEALPIVRERFPQTLYWNPQIVTDASGRATVSFSAGDAVTTWRVTALAVDRSGRLGSQVASLPVFQPLFVVPDLPGNLVEGEQRDVRVRVFNYSATAQTVHLSVQADAGLRVELNTVTLTVPPRASAAVSARVAAFSAGAHTVAFTAQGAQSTDVRRATVMVQAAP